MPFNPHGDGAVIAGIHLEQQIKQQGGQRPFVCCKSRDPNALIRR